MITLIIGLASLFHFSPVPSTLLPIQKEFIRPGQTCEWWVCAYCGTKHEDTDSSCNCAQSQGK